MTMPPESNIKQIVSACELITFFTLRVNILATYRDEYDDTYDDEFEKATFDPIAAVSHDARQRDKLRPDHPNNQLDDNPNLRNVLKKTSFTAKRLDVSAEPFEPDQPRPPSSSSNSRADRISAPRSFRDYHNNEDTRNGGQGSNQRPYPTDLSDRRNDQRNDYRSGPDHRGGPDHRTGGDNRNRQNGPPRKTNEEGTDEHQPPQQYQRRRLTDNATAVEKKRKDANKAKVGNHNRKAMAMRKQARGMI